MKRMILPLLVMLLTIQTSMGLAEADFTLHNGVKFGMSKNEVIAQEVAKNFGLQDGIYGEGTIAGIYGAVRYEYKEGKVSKCSYFYYHPSALSYAQLSKGLNEKYGPAECTSTSGSYFPVSEVPYQMIGNGIANKYNDLPAACRSLEDQVFEYKQNGSWCYYRYMYTVPLYEQWLIPQSDGSAVLIDHSYLNEAYLLIETSSNKPQGDVKTRPYELIIYTLLDKTEADKLRQNTYHASDDL